MGKKVYKSEAEWRRLLTPNQFEVTRRSGTEPPFTGEYIDKKEVGIYQCICCNTPLFSTKTQFHSGTGWPSFWAPIQQDNVALKADNSLFVRRTEVHCNTCEAHLGHVFEDGPRPTGLRYCINSIALKFVKGSPDLTSFLWNRLVHYLES